MRSIKQFFSALCHFAWGQLLCALLLCTGGVLFILFPEGAVSWVGRVLGGLTVILFTFFLARLFAWRERGLRFAMLLCAYALALICGGYILFAPAHAMEYLSIAAGLFAIMYGSLLLSLASRAKRAEVALWWLPVVFSLLSVAAGLWMLRFPALPFAEHVTENATLIGICLCIGGLEFVLSSIYHMVIERRERVAYTQTVSLDPDALQQVRQNGMTRH